MSLGSPQDLRTRNCKNLGQDLHARIPKRISHDHQKRTCCCWSGPYKILVQEPRKSLPQELSYKHLGMTSASSSCKDLLGRTSPGAPQDLLLRTCVGSCKDLLKRKLAGSPQEPDYARIYNENAADPELENSTEMKYHGLSERFMPAHSVTRDVATVCVRKETHQISSQCLH